MTDDEILDALDRRLSGVESRLPPTPVGVAGRALDGRTMRQGPSFRAGSVPAALALVAVVVVAFAFGSRVSVGVGAEASPSEAPASSVAAVATPNPTAPPLTSQAPSPPGLEVIRHEAFDGDHVLTQHLGWGPCFSSSHASRLLPDGAALDAAIDRAGITEGFVTDELGEFWVGPTAESAAVGYGSSILAIGRRGAGWIAVHDPFFKGLVGRELLRIETPKGRVTWSLGNSVRAVPCTDG